MRTSKFTQARSLVPTFARFASAGAVGTAAHYAVLVACVEILSVPAAAATACGALIGACINYALNYRLTFRSTASHRITLPKFAIVAAASAAFNAAIVAVLVRLGIPYLVGQVFATAIVLLAGFVANHQWTFRKRVDGPLRHR